MNFSFSEDQLAIQELAQQIFSKQASDEQLLESFRAGSAGYDDSLWQILAEQGLLAICVPEEFGGTGLGFTELCLLLEEQGRRVAPVPLFSSLILGALPLIEFASQTQKEKYLPDFCTGKIKFSAAVSELGMDAAVATHIIASEEADGWILTGEKIAVPDSAQADFILVPVSQENNLEKIEHVFIVDTKAQGLTIESQKNSFGENTANLMLDKVKVSKDELLASKGDGQKIVDWLEQRADTALCALQVGVCDAALKRTAEFTTERKQFGVPLGSFQAVAMRAADAYIDIEAMRSMYWQAMWRLDSGLRAQAEVRAAKWWACEGGHRVVHATQHLHGGMGSDVEFPIHRFFLWAKQISFVLGNARTQMSELGKLLAEDDTVGYAALDI